VTPLGRNAGSASGPALRVSLSPCPAPQALAPQWCALQAEAEPNFFTSWAWIGCWLHHLGSAHRPVLVRVHQGAELVGLAVLVPQRARRLRWWPSQALHLHATGERAWDDITVEHNGWLVRRGLAGPVHAAVSAQLWALAPALDQMCLPGVSAGHERWREALPPVACVREMAEPAYRIDLDAARAGRGCHLDGLGAATRSTVRRSLRLYEALGPVRLEAAASAQEALAQLERLAHWHQRHWQARGQPGAFANPRFAAFHRRLVAQAFGGGCIRLLRLAAGTHEIGYLYAFVHRGQMLAYQSGLRNDVVARNHHPGLVLHALAVQRAADEGLAGYDLMAGEARYKQQLGSQCYPMLTYSLHRPGPALWLEEGWRGLKSAWRAAPRRAQAADRGAG